VYKTGEKNKIFSQYNIFIFIVFILIVFSTFSVITYQYLSELSESKKIEISTLSQQVDDVNSALTSNAEALRSTHKFANYLLKYPKEILTKPPILSQDGDSYYINHRDYDVIGHKDYVRNNITGIGDINTLDAAHKIELAMSNMLTATFVTAKQANEEVVWFYYVSKKRFVSIYPSINRNSWQFSDVLLEGEHSQKILKSTQNNNDVIWSKPYVGSAGKGLNISLGIAVFNQSMMTGVLYSDINLAKLKKHTDIFTQKNMGVIILNQNNDVLIHSALGAEPVNNIEKFKSVAPLALSTLSNDEINDLAVYQEIGDWLVQKQMLKINGWKVIKYQRYDDFRAPLLSHFRVVFSIIFTGLFVFLFFVYWVTHRTFVKPTQRFISHIEHCAQGDPGKIKPTNDWVRWFQVVENIFGQNRSLLQRLTDQNLLLDTRVNEKTQELQEKVTQHKRDYALLSSVMDAIPEYIIFNDIEGNIVGFNDAFSRFINMNKEDVLGLKADKIILNDLGVELTKLSTSDNTQNGLQCVVQTKHNTYDIFCTNIHSDTGMEVGTIDIIRDVTAQYEIQASLKKTKDQAEFANKAKSQFLANMSHEIRTPINAMQGMITLLGRSILTNNQRQHIDNAYGASKSLLYLVDQLLDLAKIESGEMTIVKERTSIDSIINKAIKLNIGMIRDKSLNITVDISPEVPIFIETDEMRLMQVITNLLQNSIKFTQSGQISISVNVLTISKTYADVVFKIKDTGIGIATDKQSHLFEAFKQADDSMTRQYGGSGLGLSICRQIVHLLGGEISLQSELYQGCEFTIELPFQLSQENSNEFISEPLTLCNYGLILSKSVLEAITRYGWTYVELSHFNEIENLANKRNVVMLLSDNNVQHIIDIQLQEHIKLLCICQTLEHNIGVEESVLEQLVVPYIIQEQPIYRHMLNAIGKSISRLKKVESSETAQESKNLKGVVVLLVEDNLVNQLVAKELLLNMKAEVIIAENGQVALDLLEKNTIHVVLMDIQMPVMDGLMATKLIRKQAKYEHLPIIAMTAHARKEDSDNSIAAGMNLHMAKPVKYDTLLNRIFDLINIQS